MSRMHIALLQLPLPAPVPLRVCGNVPMAAATLALYHGTRGSTRTRISIVPQDVASFGGDPAIIRWLVKASPDVLGCTLTVWNVERTLSLVARVREHLPDLRVWYGGPEVGEGAWFLDVDKDFECAVEGEGEGAFAALASGVRPSEISGLLTPSGRTRGRTLPKALDSLDRIHDPFVRGLVRPEANGVVLAELQRGCRYHCVFCRYHQNRPAASLLTRSPDTIRELFEWIRAQGLPELYLLDPSLEQRPAFEDFCALVARLNPRGRIRLFVELRADFIDEGRAELLARAGVAEVETGLQSVNPTALRLMARRTDLASFAAGTRALRSRGIRVCTDVMTGLAGDTPRGLADTIKFVKDLSLAGTTQVFRTQVLPGTALRRGASQFGLVYDPRPPYYVRSTPAWPEERLAKAHSATEHALGISNAPEHRPVVPCLTWDAQGCLRASREDAGLVWAYGWDLSCPRAGVRMEREKFEQVAGAVTLWVRTSHAFADAGAIAGAVGRLVTSSPYGGVCVMVDAPVHSPLDVYDQVRAALDSVPGSGYAARMYDSCGVGDAMRRVLAVVPATSLGEVNGRWLRELRGVAEVVWLVAPAQVSRVGDAAGSDDWILVDMPSGVSKGAIARLCTRMATLPDPARVLLTGVPRHWELIEILERLERQR